MDGGTEMAATLEPEKEHARGGQCSNKPGGWGGVNQLEINSF